MRPSKETSGEKTPGKSRNKGIAMQEDRVPTQKVIDLATGRDITREYISKGLERLEVIGNELVETATWLVNRHQDQGDQIFDDFRDRLQQVIGTGSLGPATGAAGPLLDRLQAELARRFGKNVE
jgi:hypothetical protein